jgi:aminoglycoside phosphotransferase
MGEPLCDQAGHPDENMAAELATATLGSHAITVRRFTTGSSHFVFEVTFADRWPVVIRIAQKSNGGAMAGAARLTRLLRPLGVPLPGIMAEGLEQGFPYLVLERLPGTDLGHVITALSEFTLTQIAARVAEAQAITSGTRSAGRYGYAVEPEAAPYEAWARVIDAALNRSRTRIAEAGLFDLEPVERIAELIADMRPRLDALPSIPFLHDTTTKNVIVESDGSFSGIIDVDDLCFGDPRYVVALTWAATVAFGGPSSYAKGWMHIASFKDDAIFRMYIALFIVDFMSEHGQTCNGNQGPSAPSTREKLISVFEDAMRQITA